MRTLKHYEKCHSLAVILRLWEDPRKAPAGRLGQAAFLVGILALAAFTGCSGTNDTTGPTDPTLPLGLPQTPPPASSNSFTGTAGPGLWTMFLDDTQQNFIFQATTYPSSPNVATSGSFLPTAGFLSLQNSSSTLVGYAAEVPGRAALLQPGPNTVAPVFAIEQDSCFRINGDVRFQFVYMPNSLLNTQQTTGYPAYGFLDAQTTVDGSTWTFGGQLQYVLPYTLGAPGIGSPLQPGTTGNQQAYLSTFPGTCSVSNGQAKITAAQNVSSSTPVSKMPTTFVVGPTGFFVEDQSSGNQPTGTADASSAIGVVQPSAPLTTSAIVSAKYVGFMREAGSRLGTPVSITEPIGFGQIIAGSTTSMTGGTFTNDDITQFQNSNIVINLGTQDKANNGLYSLASVTVPDPNNVCVIDPGHNKPGAGGTPGVDQFGEETCTFNAVAVVGNPESKYAIFIASYDVVNNVPMGIYLFQQQ